MLSICSNNICKYLQSVMIRVKSMQNAIYLFFILAKSCNFAPKT